MLGNAPGLGTGFESLVASVEEFVPDGGELDRSFLEEVVNSTNTAVQFRHTESPDSDRYYIYHSILFLCI